MKSERVKFCYNIYYYGNTHAYYAGQMVKFCTFKSPIDAPCPRHYILRLGWGLYPKGYNHSP
jgi:hypothetical protein